MHFVFSRILRCRYRLYNLEINRFVFPFNLRPSSNIEPFMSPTKNTLLAQPDTVNYVHTEVRRGREFGSTIWWNNRILTSFFFINIVSIFFSISGTNVCRRLKKLRIRAAQLLSSTPLHFKRREPNQLIHKSSYFSKFCLFRQTTAGHQYA